MCMRPLVYGIPFIYKCLRLRIRLCMCLCLNVSLCASHHVGVFVCICVPSYVCEFILCVRVYVRILTSMFVCWCLCVYSFGREDMSGPLFLFQCAWLYLCVPVPICVCMRVRPWGLVKLLLIRCIYYTKLVVFRLWRLTLVSDVAMRCTGVLIGFLC